MKCHLNMTGQSKSIDRRVTIDYSDKLYVMKLETQKILIEVELNSLKKTSVIHDNQEQCSTLIVSNLHNKKVINIMVVALTQSGKTGTMVGLIKNFLSDTKNIIPIENIYIITGLSSCEWKEQTYDRMPESIQKRIFHRNDLSKKFVDDIKKKQNVLIINDEIQIAAKENQSLFNTFKEAGLYDKENLFNNDIKIIEFSATPDGTLYDLMNWGEHSINIRMQPGNNYTSCFDLKNSGRVKQYKDLCCYDKKTGDVDTTQAFENITEIYSDIQNFDEHYYHIIRTKNGESLSKIAIDNFKQVFGDDMLYIMYNKDTDIDDINSVLEIKPHQHTFIFIKEKLRCAKTLIKKHLGICYERFTNSPDDAVIIQGLVGRGTGYDDNGNSIFYTNIPSIEKYEQLWNTNFQDKSVKWKSKTTKFKNGKLISSGTFNNPLFLDNESVSSDDSNNEPTIIKLKTQEEIKNYYTEVLKPIFDGRGPNKRKPNSNGFYETTIGRKRGKDVYSYDEIYEVRKWGLNEKHKFTYHPCYDDVNDKSTLCFCLIYY